MKLILQSDVKALGKRGDVVDVAEGYARNFLLPRKLATEADKGALAQLGSQKKAKERRDAQTLADAKALADRLAAAKLAVKAKAGGNGKLFGAVTNADVATAIQDALSVAVDKHKIEIKSQIKALGSYPVEIKLHKNVVAKATVDVVSA
ncbi:MAG TPA: 50S ribosomal protein L9 [Candidatus Baltobacteraceae bacterium]|nr:50S ribosomal protein L9 [Candidatus Baltobacteraceae bacterium]